MVAGWAVGRAVVGWEVEWAAVKGCSVANAAAVAAGWARAVAAVAAVEADWVVRVQRAAC